MCSCRVGNLPQKRKPTIVSEKRLSVDGDRSGRLKRMAMLRRTIGTVICSFPPTQPPFSSPWWYRRLARGRPRPRWDPSPSEPRPPADTQTQRGGNQETGGCSSLVLPYVGIAVATEKSCFLSKHLAVSITNNPEQSPVGGGWCERVQVAAKRLP